MMLAIMLMFGLNEHETSILVKDNPARILGLA
jgi:ribosomal protein L30/L7E